MELFPPKYVFDTNSLSVIFKHYYCDSFVSFWKKFNSSVKKKEIISVRQVRKEILKLKNNSYLEKWVKEVDNDFFSDPNIDELRFINEIYSIKHFQVNIGRRQRLKGEPFADPFVIAKACILNCCVVTEEKYKENSAKMPAICRHFEIDCINLEIFLKREKWIF